MGCAMAPVVDGHVRCKCKPAMGWRGGGEQWGGGAEGCRSVEGVEQVRFTDGSGGR